METTLHYLATFDESVALLVEVVERLRLRVHPYAKGVLEPREWHAINPDLCERLRGHEAGAYLSGEELHFLQRNGELAPTIEAPFILMKLSAVSDRLFASPVIPYRSMRGRPCEPFEPVVALLKSRLFPDFPDPEGNPLAWMSAGVRALLASGKLQRRRPRSAPVGVTIANGWHVTPHGDQAFASSLVERLRADPRGPCYIEATRGNESRTLHAFRAESSGFVVVYFDGRAQGFLKAAQAEPESVVIVLDNGQADTISGACALTREEAVAALASFMERAAPGAPVVEAEDAME